MFFLFNSFFFSSLVECVFSFKCHLIWNAMICTLFLSVVFPKAFVATACVEEKDIPQHRTVVSLLQQSACILVLEVISVVEQDFCFWPGCLWRLSAEIKRSQSTVSGPSSSCDDLSQLNSWRTFESALWCITRSSWSNEESLLWNKGLTGQKLLASVVLTVSGRLEQLSNS